ncbi:Ribonuclease H2 subunit A [Smittium mucronatum]|uniref:Ribonuclease n=1 Tax=Smittium mucronatum TaxID=133383 RepID=A0A1R0GL44_9FUNG|nr:Ribonuclease H2 subunit A [Smittium mucronatum]
MDIQLGIVGKDFSILITDDQVVNSILTIKHDADKIYELSEKVIMSVSGEAGDTDQFCEYIVGNSKLYGIRNGIDLTPDATAKFTRGELASALRSRNPYQVNLLISGFDIVKNQPSLYRIDYLASISKVPFAAHGYGAFFSYSIFDKMYKENLTESEALDILAACLIELNKRLIIRHSSYTIKIVDKSGLRTLDPALIMQRIALQDLDFDPLVPLTDSKVIFSKPLNSRYNSPIVTQTYLCFMILFSILAQYSEEKPKYVLGVDEAGRGPVLDSKQVTEKIREDKFMLLQQENVRKDSGWAAHVLSPQEISQGMLKKNKYNLNTLAHDTTISIIQSLIKQGHEISHIYIDTVGPPESYTRKLQPLFPGTKITVAKKADSLYPIVSAASIIAKVIRDEVLKNWKFLETPSRDISLSYGSGYPSDPKTVSWLHSNIDKVFGYPSIVRFSWATCQKLLETNAYKVDFHDEGGDVHDKKLTVAQKRKLASFHNNAFSFKPKKPDTSSPQSLFLTKNRINLFPPIKDH